MKIKWLANYQFSWYRILEVHNGTKIARCRITVASSSDWTPDESMPKHPNLNSVLKILFRILLAGAQDRSSLRMHYTLQWILCIFNQLFLAIRPSFFHFSWILYSSCTWLSCVISANLYRAPYWWLYMMWLQRQKM